MVSVWLHGEKYNHPKVILECLVLSQLDDVIIRFPVQTQF